MNKKIIIGNDHAGFELKMNIKQYLESINYDVIDAGTFNNTSCDYPIIAKDVCKKITKNEAENAILICGTGIGMSIAANKQKGIRAAVVSDTCSAKYSKLHNNANVLCIGARIIGTELAKDIVNTWLITTFEGGKHKNRIDMFE